MILKDAGFIAKQKLLNVFTVKTYDATKSRFMQLGKTFILDDNIARNSHSKPTLNLTLSKTERSTTVAGIVLGSPASLASFALTERGYYRTEGETKKSFAVDYYARQRLRQKHTSNEKCGRIQNN